MGKYIEVTDATFEEEVIKFKLKNIYKTHILKEKSNYNEGLVDAFIKEILGEKKLNLSQNDATKRNKNQSTAKFIFVKNVIILKHAHFCIKIFASL